MQHVRIDNLFNSATDIEMRQGLLGRLSNLPMAPQPGLADLHSLPPGAGMCLIIKYLIEIISVALNIVLKFLKE